MPEGKERLSEKKVGKAKVTRASELKMSMKCAIKICCTYTSLSDGKVHHRNHEGNTTEDIDARRRQSQSIKAQTNLLNPNETIV